MANTLRFVAPLDPQTETRLKQIQRTSLIFRTRQRAHAILLSAKGYRIDQLVEIFFVDRDRWLDRWDLVQFQGVSCAIKAHP